MHSNYEEFIEKLLPDAKERAAFFACYHEILPRSIKIIEHKIDTDAFIKYTKSIGRKVTPPPFAKSNDSRYIERTEGEVALGKHRLHAAGFFYIQEVAASLATNCLDLQAGDIILDMCAAPGGKSTQIADKLLLSQIKDTHNESTMGPTGLVVSNEMSSSRIIALQGNLNRTGSYNTAVTKFDGALFGKILPEFFDAVLVDAPCSGEGTGFKSDASTKRRREENIHQIAQVQYALLVSAIKTCKPGGQIVYATCTLNPRENEGVIAKVLKEYEGAIALEPIAMSGKSSGLASRDGKELLRSEDAAMVARFWPHRQHTGGFFIAKFTKRSSTESPAKKETKDIKKSKLDISDSLQKKIAKIVRDEYEIVVDPQKHFFAATDNQVYLISPHYKALHPLLYVEKVGVPILKRHNDTEVHPLHGLGSMLGERAQKNTIQLTAEECQQYSDGRDLETHIVVSTPHKYAILKREKYGFSVGKVVGTTIKNKFLR